MIRRAFAFALVALAACFGSLGLASAADSLQPPTPRRIGVLLVMYSQESKEAQAFREGLRDAGYSEGRDVLIEWRSASGDYARVPELAADLVQRKVDVIVVDSTVGAGAAKRATSIIPIVMATIADPVGTGLVASLAHPGGNVTGLSMITTDLSAKRLLTALGAALLLRSATSAATDGRTPRIGFLTPFPAAWPAEEGFHQGLRELGYVEGQNILIEWRRATESYADLGPLAIELARANVDAIVTMATPAARAALDATTTTPIVALAMGNPIGTGLAQSLARPGGNITGVATLAAELASKRLDLLRQLVPRARRIGCLANSANPASRSLVDQLQSAAETLGIRVEIVDARNAADVDGALRAIPWKKIDGLVVLGEPYFMTQGAKIAQAVRKARMPAIFPFREHHGYGVLMSYGPDLREILRRGTYYVDRILKGARPADLPIEQVSKVDLIIDLRVARELGLKVPEVLLARANEVIQ